MIQQLDQKHSVRIKINKGRRLNYIGIEGHYKDVYTVESEIKSILTEIIDQNEKEKEAELISQYVSYHWGFLCWLTLFCKQLFFFNMILYLYCDVMYLLQMDSNNDWGHFKE